MTHPREQPPAPVGSASRLVLGAEGWSVTVRPGLGTDPVHRGLGLAVEAPEVSPGFGWPGVDPAAGLVQDVLIPPPHLCERLLRLYPDTSVFGGCEDLEFQEGSRHVFHIFRRGDALMITSDMTTHELKSAPITVRGVADTVPEEFTEHWDESPEAKSLAAAYVGERVLGPRSAADALHVAYATLSKADALLSWNFKHMVHPAKIDVFRAVNRRLGLYTDLDIVTPAEVRYGD